MNGNAAPAPASPANSAAVESAERPAAVATLPSLDLFVLLSATTHLRILADGQVLLDEKLPSGWNRHFPAKETFEVTAANSSAVLLELNGEAMPPLGSPGASGTMTLSRKNLRQTPGGNTQP